MDNVEPPEQFRFATGSSGQDPESGLARQLGELARHLQAEPDMAGLLRRITDTAVTEVDGADYAGISLIENSRLHTEAETDDLVTRIDGEQYRLRQGPCLSSLREHDTIRADDLGTETRWPQFALAVTDLGVRSMLAVQLFVEGENLGALNLYSARPNAFTDHDETTAMLLAAHAAIAIKRRSESSNLRVAIETRDRIGQAKGILMERFKIDEAAAFDLLVLVSQRTQTKLRDVADQVATTGELSTG